MSIASTLQFEPNLPDQAEMDMAAAFVQFVRDNEAIDINATAHGKSVPFPRPYRGIVVAIAQHLADGRFPIVVPLDRDVTTQEAAELLNVSRPHVITLLERGAIRYHMVGNRRKMAIGDVLRYRRERSAARRKGLRELANEAQTLGAYDAKP
ncbi:MAG: helix-turn-helix domain-containing protein [Dehalococcoidia bacterium]|nr:helix-turn-helix domain-containing protein [Dehalococcoidia bacterium]